MGSMQMRAGIWFFSMGLKGEVTRVKRRYSHYHDSYEGHIHIHVLHVRGREGGGEKLESTRGSRSCWGEDIENNNMQRKWGREGQRERSMKTGWRSYPSCPLCSQDGAQRRGRGGIALSLLLVTPSQLPGFMERFLTWCCFLIDIKMLWPVCHFSSSPCLFTLSPPLPLYLLNSPRLTDTGCHLHMVRRDRNGTPNSHLRDGRPLPSLYSGFA